MQIVDLYPELTGQEEEGGGNKAVQQLYSFPPQPPIDFEYIISSPHQTPICS